MKLPKTLPELWWRGGVFVVLFVLLASILGQRVVGGGILFRDGFVVYSVLGKVIIFSLVSFLVLAYRHKQRVALRPWQRRQGWWAVLLMVSAGLAWWGISRQIVAEGSWLSLVAAHGGFVASFVLLGLAVWGGPNIHALYRTYRRQVMLALFIGAMFLLFLQSIYALWRPLALIVMTALQFLLEVSGIEAAVLPPNILMFDKFSITIAEYCSGIESIALFTGFYVLVGLLERHRIRWPRYAAALPLALIALGIINIFRVYSLIMIAYFWSPPLAFGLFHTYAGTVLFIVFSGLFWVVAYKWLIEVKKGHEP